MRPFFPIIFSVAVLLSLFGIAFVFVRYLNLQWWQQRTVRRVFRIVPLVALSLISIWVIGAALQLQWLIAIGAAGTALVFVITLATILALPLSSLFNLLDRALAWFARFRQRSFADDFHTSRRRFLRTSALVFPALSASGGIIGLARSFEETRIPIKHFKFANLPRELQGLKILHLSDLHLGYYVGLSDIERLLRRLEPHRPDLILVTGDVADNLTLLPEVLRMIHHLQPPVGVFASLGNHEYFRGIKTVWRHFEASPVPLLCNTGLTLDIDGAALFVAGADDPQGIIRGNRHTFLRQTVEKSTTAAPSNTFKILLSHRPGGFIPATDLGVDLTLAGHTHGMQIGINGRSAFESWAPEAFFWGHYRRGNSQLYTSSGVGHWFPFRLGCPPEAPIIVLHRDDEEGGTPS